MSATSFPLHSTKEMQKESLPSIDKLIHSFLGFPSEIRNRELSNNPLLSQCGSISQVSPISPLPSAVNTLPPFQFTTVPTFEPSLHQPVDHRSIDEPQEKRRRLSEISSNAGSGSEESLDSLSESDEESSNDPNKPYLNSVWLKHYEELKKFKEIFYHTNVTRTKTESRRLGNWVAEQRRKKKQGRLNKSQIDLLNACGFEWEKRKRKSFTFSRAPEDSKPQEKNSAPSSPKIPAEARPSSEDANFLLSLAFINN